MEHSASVPCCARERESSCLAFAFASGYLDVLRPDGQRTCRVKRGAPVQHFVYMTVSCVREAWLPIVPRFRMTGP